LQPLDALRRTPGPELQRPRVRIVEDLEQERVAGETWGLECEGHRLAPFLGVRNSLVHRSCKVNIASEAVGVSATHSTSRAQHGMGEDHSDTLAFAQNVAEVLRKWVKLPSSGPQRQP
jgi:hypothetical protein